MAAEEGAAETGLEPFSLHKVVSEPSTSRTRYTCVSYAGQQIYIGTNDGHVRLYPLEETKRAKASVKVPSEKMISQQVSSKKNAIVRIEAVYQLGVLLCLVDGKIFLLSLRTLEILSGTINEKPGFVDFTMRIGRDERQPVGFTALLKRRSELALYEVVDEGPKSTPRFKRAQTALSLPESPSLFRYAHMYVCVSFSRGYSVVQDYGGRPKEIPPKLEGAKPWISALPSDKISTGRGINPYDNTETVAKLFAKSEGKESTSHMEWLVGTGKSYGGFFTLEGDPTGRDDIPWSNRPRYLAYKFPYLLGYEKHTNSVEVLHHRTGKSIQLVDVNAVETNPVLGVCDGWPWQSRRRRGDNLVFMVTQESLILLQHRPFDGQVEQLIAEGQTTDAFHLFLGTRQSFDTSALVNDIKLFHRTAAKACLFRPFNDRKKYETCIKHLQLAKADVREMLVFLPALYSTHLEPALGNFTPSIFTPGVVEAAMRDANGFFEAVNLREFKPSSSANRIPPLKEVVSKVLGREQNDDEVLKHCREALKRFVAWLEIVQNSLRLSPDEMKLLQVGQLESNNSLAQIVDTALMKAYVQLNMKDKLHSLLKNPTWIHVEDARDTLKRYRLYYSLSQFLVSTNRHSEALSLWEQVADSDEADIEGDPVAEAIEILRSTDDEDLIFHHSHWIFIKDSYNDDKRALGVFTQPSSRRSKEVVPDKVLAFLNEISERIPARKLICSYLEYLVNTAGKRDERFHTKLAQTYLDELTQFSKSDTLSRSNAFNATRKKLQDHLKKSDSYNAETVLSQINELGGSNLIDERVIAFGKLSQHEDALRLLVDEKLDHEDAENYCWENRDNNAPFATLMEIYFKQYKKGQIESLDRALRVFQKYLDHLDVRRCIDLIPKSAPVHKVRHILRLVLPMKLHQRRQTQIANALATAERRNAACDSAESRQALAAEKNKLEGGGDMDFSKTLDESNSFY
eukprot:gb/GECG01003851.1/.p1 GENE.gb/GECG01003851.1/~~gb/GECG01003851.1/.p1  ORF type:complete len:968 (+),score=112.52 gb/GECG01003851.1/:1-2904(+)